jgi:hypothetical protein
LPSPDARPDNRNNIIVARHAVAHLIDNRVVLGDGRYREITSITTPRHDDNAGPTIHDDHYQVHRRITPASNTSSPGSRTGRYLRQCRRRGDAINHSLHITAGLWNLKNHSQLRVIY